MEDGVSMMLRFWFPVMLSVLNLEILYPLMLVFLKEIR